MQWLEKIKHRENTGNCQALTPFIRLSGKVELAAHWRVGNTCLRKQSCVLVWKLERIDKEKDKNLFI